MKRLAALVAGAVVCFALALVVLDRLLGGHGPTLVVHIPLRDDDLPGGGWQW